MSEQKSEQKEETKELKVGEMGVEAFFNILSQIIERKREAGDSKLMDLSVKEFTAMMLDQLKTRALATAQAETSVAERVLTDWSGLQAVQAVAQPFRVRTPEEAAELAKSLADPLKAGMTGSFVVAIAIVGPEGGYQKAGG